MKYKKFKKLAEKHLFILEGYTYDKNGNKEKQIYGLEELYKQLTLTNVSQQRELLNFFSSQLSENLDIDVGMNYITEEDIEECLKNFNCG